LSARANGTPSPEAPPYIRLRPARLAAAETLIEGL
jgi:hypothetical protein